MNKHIAHNEGYKYVPLDDYKNYFYSNDFPISVTLLSKGFDLVTIDKEDEGRGKFIFVFKLTTSLGTVVDEYWLHRISVDPLDYENHRKNLKSRMFALLSK